MSSRKPQNAELQKMLKNILAKPAQLQKSPDKMPSMKEQRRRRKLIDGVMVERGGDDNE